MVNIDKLNQTIEDLELQSKEITSIIEKQKEFELLAKQIDKITDKIELEHKGISENAENITNLIETNKQGVLLLEEITQKNFSEIENKLTSTLNKSNDEILGSLTKYKENINTLVKEVTKINEDTKLHQTDIVKKLNEIISENYKVINEFHAALETKHNILKSEITSQMKQLENKIETNSENNKNALSKEIINLKESILANQNEKNTAIEEKMKKQQMLLIASIILTIIAIATNFIK